MEQAKEQWQRLRNANRRRGTIAAYRVALDDLFEFLDRRDLRDRAFHEETTAYLSDYQRRRTPAEATYYRRFTCCAGSSAGSADVGG